MLAYATQWNIICQPSTYHLPPVSDKMRRMQSVIKHIHTHPATKNGTHVCIWLHGLGASGEDLLPLPPYLTLPDTPRITHLFPSAHARPVTLNAGITMPAWFDIKQLGTPDFAQSEGVENALASCHALIDQLIQDGTPAHHIALIGFSQGGCLALYAGLTFPQPLAGIAGLSTLLPTIDSWPHQRITQPPSLPVFLAHGETDDVIDIKWGKAIATDLSQQGFAPDFHHYPGGHEISNAEIQDLSAWITAIFTH